MIKNLKLQTIMVAIVATSAVMLLLVQVLYFAQFTALTKERAQIYTTGIMNQIQTQLDNHLSSLRSSAELISYSKHVQEFLKTRDRGRKYVTLGPFVTELLSNPKASNSYTLDVFVVDSAGAIVTTVYNHEIEIMEQIMQSFGDQLSLISPQFTKSIEHNGIWYYAYIHPIIGASNQAGLFEELGYCVVLCKAESLNSLMEDINIAPNSHLLLTDSEGHVIASNHPKSIGSQLTNETIASYSSNRSMIMQERLVDSINWTVTSYVSQHDLVSDMRPILQNGILVGIAATLILVAFGIMFIVSINGSLTKLLAYLRSVADTVSIKQRVDIESRNEIGTIATWVNRMMDRVEDMTRKIVDTQSRLYDAEISRTHMELSMLQSLINPHFLYNTLNCISSIGLAYDVPEIETISTAVAKIFRYSISGNETVTVQDELDCIHEYMKIMNFRYNNKFTFEIQMADTLLRQKILKMILQPVVENALYHGIEQKRGIGHLKITATLDSDIIFCISDNGRGMSGSELEALRQRINTYEPAAYGESGKSIGIANIHHRIRLFFGDDYGVTVQSKQDAGTQVMIRFPVVG